MKDPAWKNEADQRTSEWLDADPAEGESFPKSEVPLNEQAQVRAADLQLIDALLSSTSDHAVAERANRIKRVMEAIGGNRPSANTKRRMRQWPSLLAIAASLMIGLGLLWSQFAKDTRASDALQQIGEVAKEQVDRIYLLRRDVLRSDGEQRLEGELYLRGCDGFVLDCGHVVLGRNADEYWCIENDGEVVISENFRWMDAKSEHGKREVELLKELSIDSRNVPLMQLSSVIDLMQENYEVSLSSNVYHGKQRVDEVVATLQATTSKASDRWPGFPDTISLWSGADSHIIYRAELSWGSDNTLVLKLLPARPIPTDWYQHEAHHSADRPVRRIPSS